MRRISSITMSAIGEDRGGQSSSLNTPFSNPPALPTRMLRRIQRRTQRHNDPVEFRASTSTQPGWEEDVQLRPLMYLPPLRCFACTKCHRTLSPEKRALIEHINKEEHSDVPLSRTESHAQSARLDEILLRCGAPSEQVRQQISTLR